MRVIWQGGGAFEDAGTRGATAMLATLLTKDTKARSAAAVAHAIEQVGGGMSHFAGNNSFGLSVEVLPDDFDLALGLLEEAVLRPAFRPATVKLDREAQIAELAEDDDDIVTLGRRHLRRLLFGGHYLAIESGGTTADLEKMGAAELRKLHRKLVVSGNTVLAISGDFDPKVVLPKLKRFLNKIPKAGRPRGEVAFTGSASPGEHQLPMKRQQVVVYQGYSMPGLLSDDFYVGEVADELFSGMSSNLFERVREEKGMAYFVRSSRVVGLEDGMFFFIAGTSPEQYREVVAEFELEIARVKRGAISKSEIERCRTRLKASRRMSMQSNGACASHAALNALYELPVNDWQNYDAHIDAVSVADLKRFARTYMTTKSRVRLLAGAMKGKAKA
jgi:zinc protease